MGEALSFPENQEAADGHAKDSAAGAHGGAGAVPNEGVLLSQLIQLLSQRQRHSLLLSDLGALLPGSLRQRVKDQGGLRSWLQRYPSLFLVCGQPGKESVKLILGGSPGAEEAAAAAAEDAPAPAARGPEPPEKAAPAEPVLPGQAAALGGGAALVDAQEGEGDSAVQLRGLPYRATKEDVRAFLGDFALKLAEEEPIHLVLNRDGRPSGFARVQFTSPEAARQCQDELHLRSMDDRYVEVFLYSERPSRGRQRRSTEDGVALTSSEALAGRGLADTPAVSREQVVRECRAEMAEPKNRRLLLSMLGVALSPGARSYLKQMDQGLKHFLAQFPGEFSVEGGKGCEYVTYTPTIHLSEAIDNFNSVPVSTAATSAPSFPRAVGSSAPLRSGIGGSGTGPEPSSPKPTKTPPQDPTPSAGRGFATPSDWGTPSGAPCGSTSMLPPWPSVPGAGMPTGEGEGAVNPWGAPSTWPMPPPQFWAGWPQAMYPPWGPTAPPEVASHPPLGPGAAAASYAVAKSLEAQGLGPGAGCAAQVPFGAPRTMGEAMANVGAPSALSAAVRLRGLPFTSSEQDVLAFFAQHDIVDRISDGRKAVNLLLRSNGRPSGQAVVQMRDRSDAELAQRVLHGQWMGSRYIEVFLYSDDSDPMGGGAGAAGPGPAQPPGHAQGAPPWFASPWAGMQRAVPGGQLAVPDATETSWEALFEFLGPEGVAAAAAAAGAGGPLPTAVGGGSAAA